MCGLAGIYTPPDALSPDRLRRETEQMLDALRHRGPDDRGTWWDAEAGISLGVHRLAIQDTSSAGHQPMMSPSGRYLIAYNGEIYNFRVLRDQLRSLGLRFRGASDTEVLLQAIDQWGVEGALPHLNGMFAFALWDRQKRRLSLVRDRLGEKPLYYGWIDKTLVFASELKAIQQHSDFQPTIDSEGLNAFFRLRYIPAPLTIFKNVHKLPPATLLSFDEPRRGSIPKRYWNLEEVARTGIADPLGGKPQDIADEVEAALSDSVRARLSADVPVGAFLSGGIDSATIVSLMASHGSQEVKTFTVGFAEESYDESTSARSIAAHLTTDHSEVQLSPDDVRREALAVPAIYDEPFADSSQLAVLLVSRLAREQVTVVLSGDGGDELFGGYNRHVWAERMALAARIPPPVRHWMGAKLLARSPERWDQLYGRVRRILPGGLRMRIPGEKIHKVGRALLQEDLHSALVSHWDGLVVSRSQLAAPAELPLRGASLTERLMCHDAMSYLPDDILTKVDRATMSVGLEARAPYLDHQLVELAWRVPLGLKVRQGRGKILLRRINQRHVPPELGAAPKMGFGVPIAKWLRGPLRSWADDLLDHSNLSSQGLLDATKIRQTWDRHVSGEANFAYQLWDVLIFQAWIDRNFSRSIPVVS